MKKFLLLTGTSLLFAFAVSAQNGVYIEMKTTADGKGPGGAATYTGNIKLYHDALGSRMENEMNGTSGKSIKSVMIRPNDKSGKAYSVDETNKTYFELPTNTTASKSDSLKVTVKVIGDETVNGYACKHIEVTDNWGTMDEWLTSSIVMEDSFRELFAKEPTRNSDAYTKALKAAGVSGFPARIKRKSASSTTTMDLVKYEKKSLDASLFKVPDGYTKKESPAFMGMGSGKSPSEMTPEERQQFIEQMKKMMEQQKSGGGN